MACTISLSRWLMLFAVIFMVDSDLQCQYVSNIAYSSSEGDTNVIGVFPLNKCISFYQVSTDQFESERYSCDSSGNLRVDIWYNDGGCDGGSDYAADATSDKYNCDGEECENILYLQQTNRFTTSSTTCPEINSNGDQQGSTWHVFNECYNFEGGSMMEVCVDNATITYYQYSDTNCTLNKQEIYKLSNGECVNRADAASCGCQSFNCVGKNVDADSAYYIYLNHYLLMFYIIIYCFVFPF